MSSEQAFITIGETAKRYKKSKRTIWTWISRLKDEGFPQPTRVGIRAVVLDFEELLQWERKRGSVRS